MKYARMFKRQEFWFCALMITFASLVHAFWLGYLGSDDATYISGAYGWIEQFPFVGGHGSFRYTVTVPVALSFLSFGESEVTASLPTFLYCLALIWILQLQFQKDGTFNARLCLCLLLLTSPLLVIWSSVVSVDIVEAFFVFASLHFFSKAKCGDNRLRYLVLAGACASLGFLTRETTVFLVFFYGILFVFGYGFDRKNYWIMAAGFMGVWLIEVAYFTVMTGDPLYRISISLNHDSSIDRSIDLAGNVIVNEMLDPLLVLLLNQEYVLLFWIGIPLIVWLTVRSKLSNRDRDMLILYGGSALVWFLCAGAATSLLPLNPRYFLITALGTVVLIVLAISKLAMSGLRSRNMAIALVFAILVGNFAGLYVENKNLRYGYHKLAEWASVENVTVYTDKETFRRSRHLMRWSDVDHQVVSGMPRPGELYFHNPSHGEDMPEGWSNWELLKTAQPESKASEAVLRALNIWQRLSPSMQLTLSTGHKQVALYRVR